MKSSAHCLLTLFALLGIGALTQSARADEPLRIAVVEVRKVALPPKLGEQPVRTSAATGARQAGVEVLDTGRAGATCADEGCWAKVAQAAQATHVLVVDASYGRLSYKLSVAVWSAADRERRTPATAECTTCPAKDMLAKVSELSEQVVSAEKARRPAAAPAPEVAIAPSPAAPPAPMPPPVAAPAATTSATAEPEGQSRGRVMAYSLLGGGATLVAAGAIVWSLDGRQSRCERDPAGGQEVCLDTMKTKTLAVPLLALGVAGLAWGGYEWWDTRAPRVAIAVGPSSIFVSGSF